MAIAQQLYEGVDIEGEGTVGLITYMRTDSLRISEEALTATKEFILGRYGKDYYPAQTHRYKAKAGAQDAHGASGALLRWQNGSVRLRSQRRVYAGVSASVCLSQQLLC